MDPSPAAAFDACPYVEELQRVALPVFQRVKELEEAINSTRNCSFERRMASELRDLFLNRSLEIVEHLNKLCRLLVSDGLSPHYTFGALQPQYDINGMGESKVSPTATSGSVPAVEKSVANNDRTVSPKRRPQLSPSFGSEKKPHMIKKASLGTKEVACNGAINRSDKREPAPMVENSVEGDCGAESPSPFTDVKRSKTIRGSGKEREEETFDKRRKKLTGRDPQASKRTVRFRGKNPDLFNDGWTWRKYGQKQILRTSNPRCYYRCSHSGDLDCRALKRVQKCEGDTDVFDITYIGQHTCRSTALNSTSRRALYPSASVDPARLHLLDPEFIFNSSDRNFPVVGELQPVADVTSMPSSSSNSTFSDGGQLLPQCEKGHPQTHTEQQVGGLPIVVTAQDITSSLDFNSFELSSSRNRISPCAVLLECAHGAYLAENRACHVSKPSEVPTSNELNLRGKRYEGFGRSTPAYPFSLESALNENQHAADMPVKVSSSPAVSQSDTIPFGKYFARHYVPTATELQSNRMLDSVNEDSPVAFNCHWEFSTDETSSEFYLDMETDATTVLKFLAFGDG